MVPAVTRDWAARAAAIYLRTSRHPAVDWLEAEGWSATAFDYLYEAHDSFADVYRAMVDTLLERAAVVTPVLFLVPGNPLVAEDAVTLLRQRCAQQGVELRVETAPGFLDLVCATAEIDPGAGLQVVDAYRIAAGTLPAPDLVLVVAQLHSRLLAADVKLQLLEVYDEGHPVTIMRELGGAGRLETLPLSQLDHSGDFDHLTSLLVRPVDAPGGRAAAASRRFYGVIDRLLSDGGCPWDRKQTHQSLRPYLIEECYEAVEAMDPPNPEALAEELGDVLLQIYLHSAIAARAGSFELADVIAGVHDKMVRRHPHVFGDVSVRDTGDVLVNWERIKRDEKGEAGSRSLLDDIPRSLPALLAAIKVQQRASRMGFDWPDQAGPQAKLLEEMEEVTRAQGAEQLERELGDLLFSVVNWARFLSVSPETALWRATRRFAARFAAMEELARQQGLDFGRLELAELDTLWEKVKNSGPTKED